MEVCEACGKTITNGSIHSKYGVVCSTTCYDHLREKKLETAAKVIEKPSDFKEWEGQNMSEIFLDSSWKICEASQQIQPFSYAKCL